MDSTTPIQISFATAEYEGKKAIKKREIFLAKIEQVVPWSRLMEDIEPCYPNFGKRGRPGENWAKERQNRLKKPRKRPEYEKEWRAIEMNF
jgi:IS5 family transposase